MEGVKLLVLSCRCCPAFSTIEESTEDASLIHFSLMFTVSWLLFHTLSHSLDITSVVFAMHLSISTIRDRLLAMVEPRYVKLSTASSKILTMLIAGGTCMSWAMMLVFLALIISPSSLQVSPNVLINCFSWSVLWETNTTSSTK